MAEDDDSFIDYNDLPVEAYNWPCETCGADHAPSFAFDDDLNVKGCANCGEIQAGTHIKSEHCWCHPRKEATDPQTGETILRHNPKQ